MPFRLTPQLTNFLLPLDADGLLKHNMVHTMSGIYTSHSLFKAPKGALNITINDIFPALAENRDILLNIMDVFIKEPLMDWEKLARRLVREQNVPPTSLKIWFCALAKEGVSSSRKTKTARRVELGFPRKR